MTRHTILLSLIPAALLAQSPAPGTARVWKGNDGSRWSWDATTGHPHRLPDKIRWAEYGLYFAAVGADYGGTRYALSHGARETFPLYQCSPPRPGCISNAKFWSLSAIPVSMWLLNDLWLHKRISPRAQRIHRIVRKVRIGMHFGAAAWNIHQGAKK